MSLIQTAAELFAEHSAYELDVDEVTNALEEVLPVQDGELDIGQIIENFTGNENNLIESVTSWLEDGANQELNADDLIRMVGEEPITTFAENLGIDYDDAVNSLSHMLPELIDGNSEGGSFFDDLEGNLTNWLNKLF